MTTQDFASETTGGSGCDQRTLKLAINKEVGYEQCGVLVPNSYFGGGHGNITMWASEVTGQDSKLEPFASRKGKAMYRGSLHPDPDNVFSNERFCSEVAYGNYARISAFASSLDHPDEVDAKCVDGKRHACKLPPPSCVGIVNDFNSGLKPKARIDGKFLDDKDYRNHKYLLNLPGAASGSYSKNLNHLWRTGSVVMQWVHPFVEWYRPVRKSKFKLCFNFGFVVVWVRCYSPYWVERIPRRSCPSLGLSEGRGAEIARRDRSYSARSEERVASMAWRA